MKLKSSTLSAESVRTGSFIPGAQDSLRRSRRASSRSVVIPRESVQHSVVFRQRRTFNWLVLGITYSAMYTGRYNLALANPLLSQAYGWDKMQMGGIITPALFAYGIFAMFNGHLADRIGGRKAILIGSIGTVIFNFLFGLGAYLGFLGQGSYLIAYFASVWLLNSYFQSFAAVSVIKVNSAWFHVSERGVFSAIFGSMIQMGRALVFFVGPVLTLFLPWQGLFFAPSLVVLVMAAVAYFSVRNSPEDCGLEKLDVADASSGDTEPVTAGYILRRIFMNPVTLMIALAEFCTGFVRQGFEQWFPRYMLEVQNFPMNSPIFQRNAMAVIIAGISGAVFAGSISDLVFKGRRTPVAFMGYFIQFICLGVIWKTQDPHWIALAFMGNSFAITVVHSMLSGTASMDFGGKKAAATAAGFFDGMQYIGGSFVGLGMGWLLDRFGWVSWGPSMIGFSVVGMILMALLWNAQPKSMARR
jgi:OPA family glycerol-3-phosphate transporter-like MFS transporter